MQSIVKVEDVSNLLAELEDAYFDIPFENSDYQNRVFVVAAQQTPARAYRALGLKMFSKIQAVKNHLFQQERAKIDLEEKEWKLQQPTTSEFDKRRIQLDIQQMQDGQKYAAKLLNDALRELDCLYAEFKKLPKYTREQFENEEEIHFMQRLQRQLSANGAQESLLNMTEDAPQMSNRIQRAIAFMDRPRELKSE